jgi:NNP family nitrate/nitrite transporter-like MFS transporter
MIGEIGALGGSIIPTVLSISKQHTGSYRSGWIAYAALALVILGMLRLVSRSWTKTWVGPGGRALPGSAALHGGELVVTGDGLLVNP